MEQIRKNPKLHVQPVHPDNLYRHLASMARGAMLSTDTLTSGDFVNARREANRICGWQSRACGPHLEMKDKGVPEEKIIENLLDIEVKMWEILAQWEKENLSRNEALK
ncbi:MAG: hypothetical protein IT173_12740 [Acidobacteria bacterium]|nr:hypothetical protein [Acidobacteriota bacterium]